ncbi:MAG TPA: ribosome biogenesis GTP-binding protein YihA/YsxC [Bryobacteraceae bacterium]|nr:GTP-binding protein [Bryobacterales bacterium]HRJ18444.1 ribosome biogenesis GTP-binding protein YihA/YsxC [Bryobacteraceae bacterium]
MVTPAEFLLSATRADQFPSPGLPEIAFLGRSNVGKSTLLNTLTGQRHLAYSSSTPGRTQSVNFFRVDERFVFVDLPGYGYAKAPKPLVDSWKPVIDAYLRERTVLALSVLLVDARRAWMESDLQLKEWLEHHGRPYLVVATKVDKLNQKEKSASQKAFREYYPEGDLIWFSGPKGQGVKEIWQAIWKTQNR